MFDEYDNGKHNYITFDLAASKEGIVIVHQQNGDGARYKFERDVEIMAYKEYKTHSIEVCIYLSKDDIEQSYLPFYGVYGTDVKPKVKNIK